MAEHPAGPVTQTRLAGDIGVVTISKPPVNPLSADVCAGLLEAFDELEQARVRVVVLAADPAARIWSAGHDIHEIPLDGHDAVTWTTGFERLLRRVRLCPAPVIAMLHSSVWGAACDLAVTCDLATGTPRTTFALTPVKLGISYNTGGMSHFLAALPLHVIKEMAFTGEPLSAPDAYRFGLLNRLVEPERAGGSHDGAGADDRRPRASGRDRGQDRATQPDGGSLAQRRRVRGDPVGETRGVHER